MIWFNLSITSLFQEWPPILETYWSLVHSHLHFQFPVIWTVPFLRLPPPSLASQHLLMRKKPLASSFDATEEAACAAFQCGGSSSKGKRKVRETLLNQEEIRALLARKDTESWATIYDKGITFLCLYIYIKRYRCSSMCLLSYYYPTNELCGMICYIQLMTNDVVITSLWKQKVLDSFNGGEAEIALLTTHVYDIVGVSLSR